MIEHELAEVSLGVDSLANLAVPPGSEKWIEKRLRSLQTDPSSAVFFVIEDSPASVRASADLPDSLRRFAIRLVGKSPENARLSRVGERQVVFIFTTEIRGAEFHPAVAGAFYSVSHAALPPNALDDHQGRRLVAKIDGVDGTFTSVPGLPQIYYFAPTSSLDDTRRHNLFLAATGVLVFSFVSIAIALFLSRKIMGPLQSLVASARQIASGDHSAVERPQWSRISELNHFQHSLFDTVTQLKQAEESIRENEERLRAIFESSPIGVGISKPKDGTIRFSNARSAEMFRLPPEEFVGSTSRNFWTDEADRNDFLETFMEQGRVPTREARLKRADGSVFWCHLCWEMIQFQGDDHILFWIYDLTELKEAERKLSEARDLLERRVEERTAELQRQIAERVRTEDQLRESESILRAIIENMPSAVSIKDVDGSYLVVNKCWNEWHNPNDLEIRGKSADDFFPEDFARSVWEKDREALTK